MRRKCFGQLARLRKLKDVPPVAVKQKIYCALVLPHLDYCSVVWHECTGALNQRMKQVQNYRMRLILSKPYRTPSEEMRISLQWTALAERCWKFRLTMVHASLPEQTMPYGQA